MTIDHKNWKLIKSTHIREDFEGFDEEMTFELIDGTYYYQKFYKYSSCYLYRPSVNIYKNDSDLIIKVDGMDDFVEVEETTGYESRIINEFNGWSHHAIFKLQNGQVWKQKSKSNEYFPDFRPRAAIIKVGNTHMLSIKGKSVRVERVY